MNENNFMDIRNMPWFDMGDLPNTYSVESSEADQVFFTPSGEAPRRLIVKYDTWNGCYDYVYAYMVFNKYMFGDVGISFDDIEETLKKATNQLQDYRGKLARIERIRTLILAILSAVVIITAISIGMTSGGYGWPFFLVICLVIVIMGSQSLVKSKSSYALRMSHFLLSVLCRAENNRMYLERGVEVRPGYLGKWIEFIIPENSDIDHMISQMRLRFLRETLNHKTAQFDREIFRQRDLIEEQRDIERQIREGVDIQMRERLEQMDLAEAIRESEANDLSVEVDNTYSALHGSAAKNVAVAYNDSTEVQRKKNKKPRADRDRGNRKDDDDAEVMPDDSPYGTKAKDR